jgi:hypothetical protein
MEKESVEHTLPSAVDMASKPACSVTFPSWVVPAWLPTSASAEVAA